MPIYAYKCGSCGHAKDVLQKLSDTPLSVCPACGAEAFSKQITAAGFQLKGSGWYVTDFRGGNSGSAAPATDSNTESNSAPKSEAAAPASTGDAPKKEASSASTASAGGSSSSTSTSTN